MDLRRERLLLIDFGLKSGIDYESAAGIKEVTALLVRCLRHMVQRHGQPFSLAPPSLLLP